MYFELLKIFGIISVLELADAAGLQFVDEAVLNATRNTGFFDSAAPIYNFESMVAALGYEGNTELKDIITDCNLEWYYKIPMDEEYGVRSLRQSSNS
jgi:hypothetical protein